MPVSSHGTPNDPREQVTPTISVLTTVYHPWVKSPFDELHTNSAIYVAQLQISKI